MNILKAIYLGNRIFYLLAAVAIIFCLAFIWGALFYAALAMLAGLAVAAGIDAFNVFRSVNVLRVTRETNKLFSLFDDNDVTIRVENPGHETWNVKVIDELPVQFQIRDFEMHTRIMGGEIKKLRYQLKPLKRGMYHFGRINAYLSTGWRLVERRIAFPSETIVKVYPSLIQMKAFELMVFSADRKQEGIKRIRRIGHGYEFSDIRQYVPGDDPRAINWKASSRAQAVMLNNYQQERAQQIYAVINKSRVMRMPFNGLSLMDYAINATLSLQNIVLQNQDNAGLITFSNKCDTFLRAERKFDQRQRLFELLYNTSEDQAEADYEALYETIRQNIKGRSLLILFTHFLSLNSLQRVLPKLRHINRSHLLTVIFFENTELEAYIEQDVKSVLDITTHVMATRLSNELKQVVYELRNAGIQTIQSRPEELTVNAINKYLELKSRGMI